jgi:hypothetical protein
MILKKTQYIEIIYIKSIKSFLIFFKISIRGRGRVEKNTIAGPSSKLANWTIIRIKEVCNDLPKM